MTRVRVVRGRQSDNGLKLSYDRKVSPRGWYQDSRRRWVPTVPNSFGLPAGDSCPGKTEFCTSCYAVGSEQSKGVYELVNHNLRLLKAAETVDGMAVLLGQMIDSYAGEANRMKLPPADRLFRIHWDGDFFAENYARAWARTIRSHSDIQFWAYTRSFVPPVNVVPILADVQNLALYLSADEWNIEPALALAADYPQVHLAICTEDYRSGRELLAESGRDSLVCPENSGRMDLMTDGRGACVECRLCPDAKRDVLFSTLHREDVSAQLQLPISAITVGYCANPDCGKPIKRRPGPGKAPKWCRPVCRWAVYRVK